MPARLLLMLLVVTSTAPAFAGNAKRARALECRQSCGPAIQACIDGGGRPRKCTRNVRKLCRKSGLDVCRPPDPPPGPTLAVAPGGADVSGCGTPDAPCATIQFVIDTLVPRGTDATIKVAAGTFDVSASCDAGTGADRAVVCVVDRHVTLLGGFAPPNWATPRGDPSVTVIDATEQGRGVVVVRSNPAQTAALTMDGFTVRNGKAQGAGSGDELKTWAFGAGMLAGNCPIVLRHLVFRDNVATGGTMSQSAGGRGAGGGLAMTGNQGSTPSATLQDVTFEGNAARGGDGRDAGGYALGGAMFAFGYAVSADGVVFTSNTAAAGSSNGEGIAGTDKADALGGAMAASVDSTVDLRHVHATGNEAIGGNAPNGEGGGAFGGAFFAELATFALSDAVVTGNRARGGDGRNDAPGSSMGQGGGIMATKSAVTVDRVVLVANEVRSGDGAINGGISEGGAVTMTVAARDGLDLLFTIRNAVIANNLVSVGAGAQTAGGGGALWIQGARGTLEHVTIADNRLGDSHLLGGGVGILPFAGLETRVLFVNGILANHRSAAIRPEIYTDAALWVAEGATADVTTALFANNAHDSNAGIWDVYNVPSGTINLSGIQNAPSAGFVSAGDPDNDYHLTAGSPAVDQASPGAVATDLDGTARPAGAAADLGAYEFTP